MISFNKYDLWTIPASLGVFVIGLHGYSKNIFLWVAIIVCMVVHSTASYREGLNDGRKER